jgi:DNA replication protein DnaC
VREKGTDVILQETIGKLGAMKLHGMVAALSQWKNGGMKDLDPADLLGILADAEWTDRENRRLTRRLQEAHFALPAATIEEIDYQHSRKLQKAKMVDLYSSKWVAAHQNIIVTGPTGIGKSYLPCALGNKACRDGYRAVYYRAPRLFTELFKARADGTYLKLLQRIAKFDVLIVDDLGGSVLDAMERRDLREILEDRYGVSSTIVSSQLATDDWHSFIGDATAADAICDRLINNAHIFDLDGESIRKRNGLHPQATKKGANSKK